MHYNYALNKSNTDSKNSDHDEVVCPHDRRLGKLSATIHSHVKMNPEYQNISMIPTASLCSWIWEGETRAKLGLASRDDNESSFPAKDGESISGCGKMEASLTV